MGKHNVNIDVQTIKKDSKIYKDLKPESFLFEHRNRLNDAALNIALDIPTLVSNKGTLLERAKRKVEADGYVYKKEKSYSSSLNAPEPEKSVKMKPSIRAKKLEEISEDLEEVKKGNISKLVYKPHFFAEILGSKSWVRLMYHCFLKE